MAFGISIGVLVKVLLFGSGGVAAQGKGGSNEKPENAKEWLRNKLKALASHSGKLAAKVAEALPSIIGAIICWIFNGAKEVVGWVPQNLWVLVVGVRGLLYMYMAMRK